MAKLKILKLQIAAMISDSQNIIERLQRRGVVEISNIDDERLIKMNTSSSVAIFERNLISAQRSLEILEKYSENKKSLLESFSARKKISTDSFAKLAEKNTESGNFSFAVISADKETARAKDEIAKSKITIETLSHLKGFDLPMNFAGTEKTAAIFGSFPNKKDAEELSAEIFDETEKNVFIEVVNEYAGEEFIFAVCEKDDKESVEKCLRAKGFVKAAYSFDKTPSEKIAEEEEKIRSLEKKISECEDFLKSNSKRIGEIEFLCDFLQMKIDKYKALSEVGISDKTIIVQGYIPEKYAKGLEAEFEKKYERAYISFSEIGEDEEEPVLLENGKFSAPLEQITEMYAMPNKKDIDPSAVMAFFYYLFFGMMLSDAGYGLLMTVGCSIILWKLDLEERMKNTMRLFRNCGISTLFWGILFGSWFGDLPQIIATNFFGAKDFSTALWFEPLDKPITLLLFSFGLGILHLFLGLCTHFYVLWKEGKKLDAVFEVIPTIITVLGVCPLGASILTSVPDMLKTIGLYLLIIGVVLVILTAGRTNKNFIMRIFGGLYALYNLATGYLGDILSYSRLLALGLATGSIAGVINLIATMPDNKVFKAVMLIVVGIIGHTANMAINLLGAYVHSDRLQFVELFSKFYEGGGRAFAPLKANTKSFKFEKENIYND